MGNQGFGITDRLRHHEIGSRRGEGYLPSSSLALLLDVFEAAAHEERLLGEVVVLALAELLERLDRLGDRHEGTVEAGERLGDEGVLRQETLDAAGPVDEDLVLLGELVDAEDRDDVLQVLVALQDLLDPCRDGVVLVADVARVEDARGRVERVHGRVDAQLGDRAREHGRGVEVRERRVRRRVGDVVGRHVDRLHRGDRVTTRRGDALLEHTHLVGEVGLVAHRGRHPAEQGGDLGAGLGEPEDVVDEQQHVLLLHVAEVLRHRERTERHPKPGAGRLVHLAEDQRRLLDDSGLGHLQEQVVALSGALTDTGEDRDTAEVLGDAVDHLLDEHGLADTGTAEQADLSAEHVRREQVDDLDAGLEHLGLGLELVEGRRRAVDPPALLDVELSSTSSGSPSALNTWPLVTSPTGTVIGLPGVGDLGAADEAVGRLHRDRAHQVVAEVLGDLEGEMSCARPESRRRP